MFADVHGVSAEHTARSKRQLHMPASICDKPSVAGLVAMVIVLATTAASVISAGTGSSATAVSENYTAETGIPKE